ncbi:MAG: glycosyltransferase family 4 protein [Taibaiella sp.]|nr:glycosyltransferase family 4 protein [Taibaiella sp.]
MKILQVIDRLEAGGAERLLISITHLLADKDVSSGVLLFNDGGALDKELDPRVEVHLLNRTNKFNLFTLYKAHRICKQYDIVHAHLRHVYAYIRMAQLLFGGKYKLLLHDHAAITNDVPVRMRRIFKPRYYIGVNEEQTNWAIKTIGVEQQNVFLLQNTVLAKELSSNLRPGSKKVILIANIRQVKNIEFAISLCRSMGWQLDIYGNIIEQEYYDRLKELAGDDNGINIITGVTDFSSLYRQYNLAIHCSPKETGPLVLIEYLAVGLPFIAYQTGSAADIIAAELPQLFMQNFEPEQWQQRITEIIQNEDLPRQMQQLFKMNFNPEDYINKCLQIYQSVHS